MAAGILHHVAQRVAHLPRRPQDLLVVALGQDLAAPAQRAVDRAGEADVERLHAARQRLRASRLADQVHVGALDGELTDAEVLPLAAAGERLPQRRRHAKSPQPPDPRAYAYGHMNGKSRRQRGPASVPRRPTTAPDLAPCTLALATPRRGNLISVCIGGAILLNLD
jgi:hypothetical protein